MLCGLLVGGLVGLVEIRTLKICCEMVQKV